VVTESDGVHRHREGSAPSGVVRCHRRFSAESKEAGLGHRLGTTMPSVVHCPIFQRASVLEGCPGWSPPPLFGDFLAIGIRPLGGAPPCLMPSTAVFSALIETSSFAPTALFGLGAINRGGAQAWAGY